MLKRGSNGSRDAGDLGSCKSNQEALQCSQSTGSFISLHLRATCVYECDGRLCTIPCRHFHKPSRCVLFHLDSCPTFKSSKYSPIWNMP